MILLLICFVSLLFVSFRMVSLPIDFVSHPKIPVSLRSETSKTGGFISLFREKKFRFVSLQFRFEAKFGDTLVGANCINTVPLVAFKENKVLSFGTLLYWEVGTTKTKFKKYVI